MPVVKKLVLKEEHKATPAPWHVFQENGQTWRHQILETSSKHIVGNDLSYANAMFICKAVNSHDALVSALQMMVREFGATAKMRYPGHEKAAALEEANAILHKALLA